MELVTKDRKKVDPLEAIETQSNTATLAINPLESEAIYIFREVVSQFEKPVLLFSGGKDSACLGFLS